MLFSAHDGLAVSVSCLAPDLRQTLPPNARPFQIADDYNDVVALAQDRGEDIIAAVLAEHRDSDNTVVEPLSAEEAEAKAVAMDGDVKRDAGDDDDDDDHDGFDWMDVDVVRRRARLLFT